MISTMHGPLRKLRALTLAVSCAASALAAGCADPKQDDFKSKGGISPDPTGIISGSILYVGPRPHCEYKNGKATRVRGRVLLTLFVYDNPPPPEGRATSALNLMAINGDQLFAVRDCLPEGAEPDLEDKLTRTIDYSWPQIALGPENGKEVTYQVRGFYDADEDMNPFFSVKNLPTAGDIAGAALVNVQDPSEGFLRITMPPVDKAQNGYERSGVIVALGNYVWLERPAFKLSDENRYLNSKLTVASVALNGQPVPGAIVLENWKQLCETEDTPDCGPRLQQLESGEVNKAFAKGDIHLDFAPEQYAFISEPVDILTVNVGTPGIPSNPGMAAPDAPGPDGIPDPHPLLGGTAFVPWFTPIVIMTRAAATKEQQAIELKAGIPNVRLIASTLLNTAGTAPLMRTQTGDLPISVPPIAAVELDPLKTECRVPYIAPGNYTVAFESRFTYCHDLPTGVFGISTIQGAAGGTRDVEPDPTISETGFVYNGGRLSGQAWTLPNDLAVEEQVGRGNTVPSQGMGGLFIVHEGEQDPVLEGRTCEDPTLDPVKLVLRNFIPGKLCEPGDPLIVENVKGSDGFACLPQYCCDGVEHLCGLPLCDPCTEETCPGLNIGDRVVYSGPTRIIGIADNGKSIPNCVPFELPTLCCPGLEGEVPAEPEPPAE